MQRLSAAIVTLVTGCMLVPTQADACEFATTWPNHGVLAGDLELGGVVPRNVAFLVSRTIPKGTEADTWLVAELGDGTPVVANALPNWKTAYGEALAKPLAPLPANTAFSAYRWTSYATAYVTSEQLDEAAPGQPEVVKGAVTFHDGESGCQHDSCGDYTSLSIQLAGHVTDDLTPAERLVYAIYLGQTAEEAATKVEADLLHISGTQMFAMIDAVWFDRNVFLAVAAVDQAANFSARSVPIQIHSSDNGGCSVPHSRRRLPLQAILLGVAVAVALLRRAQK